MRGPRRFRARRAATAATLAVVATVAVVGMDVMAPSKSVGRRSRPVVSRASDQALDAFATMLSRDLRGLDPTPTVRARYQWLLMRGVTRAELAALVARDYDALDLQIHERFQAILGGPPSPAVEAQWLVELRGGRPVADLSIDLYAGPELYAQLGRSNAAFVDHLYRDLLGREPSARRRRELVGLLDRGAPRAAVVRRVWSSSEATGRRVDGLYRQYLGRPPSTARRAAWVERLRTEDDVALVAALAGGAEYWKRARVRVFEPHVGAASLSVATEGVPYRSTLEATGGTPPYRWKATGLPSGLVLDNGAVSGTPTGPTNVAVTVQVRDADGQTARRVAPLQVVEAAPARRPIAAPGAGTPVSSTVLTPDGSDEYRIAVEGRAVSIAPAPGNVGSNLRAAVMASTAPEVASGQSCATSHNSSSELAQEGIALQVRSDGGRVRGLTVTKNVMFGSRWIFNLHTWDSTRPTPYRSIATFDLRRTFRDADLLVTSPWRLCGRTLDGVLEFKAWPADRTEPAWGDPRYGGAVQLPDEWVFEGRPGWFVGHLPPGEATRYRDLTTWAYETADRP